MERLTECAAICFALAKGEPPKSILVIPAGKFLAARQSRALDKRQPRGGAAGDGGARYGARPADRLRPRDGSCGAEGDAGAGGRMDESLSSSGRRIWADVMWTPAGAAAVAAGEWGYFSPVFDFTKKGRHVTRIMRGALTNNPALYDSRDRGKEHRRGNYDRSISRKDGRLLRLEPDATLEAICAAGEKKGMDADEFQGKMAAMFRMRGKARRMRTSARPLPSTPSRPRARKTTTAARTTTKRRRG